MKPQMTATDSPSKTSIRTELPVITLLTIGAFIVRVLCVVRIDRIVWGDEPFYLWLGRNWLTGHGYTFTGYQDVHHTPLFPLLSGIFYLMTGDLQVSSNIVYVICGALFVIPIYLIGYEMYGRRAAVLAAVLAGVWPAITVAVLHWGTMTEPPYLLFIYSGIYCGLLALRERGRWPALFAGAFLALAYLTRPEAIGYLVAIVGLIAIVRLGERRLFTRRTMATLLLVILGYMLFFFPYAYYVRQTTGEWMVSEKAGVTYVTSKSLAYGDTVTFDKLTWGLDSAGTEVFFFSPESYNVSIIEVIRQDPWDFVRLFYTNVRRFWNSLLSIRLFPYWLLPLIVLGWMKRPWSRDRLKIELYLLAAISPVLGFLVFFIQDRYILALVPGLIIWAASGLSVVQEWLEATLVTLAPYVKPRLAQLAAVGLPLLFVLGYLAASVPTVIRAANTGSWRWEHRTIGLWLRDNTPPGGIVETRYPAIAFYAEKRWIPSPNAPIADALRYSKIKNATYWVVDQRETAKLRPQFAPLLEGEATPDLVPIYTDTSSSEKLIVYRLVVR